MSDAKLGTEIRAIPPETYYFGKAVVIEVHNAN
jgi:hypothetical protein